MDKKPEYIPFAVIVSATNGDDIAIQEILRFYDSYISKLSYGNCMMNTEMFIWWWILN